MTDTDIAALWGKSSGGIAKELTSTLRATNIKFNRDHLLFTTVGSTYKITLTKVYKDGKD